MYHLVVAQCVVSAEGFFADGTLEGFFAGMTASVSGQAAGCCETLLTQTAGVRPVTTVRLRHQHNITHSVSQHYFRRHQTTRDVHESFQAKTETRPETHESETETRLKR